MSDFSNSGMEDLAAENDEKECLEAFSRLKASVRVHGEHKQKVHLNLGVNGIQLIDELTQVREENFLWCFSQGNWLIRLN